MKTKKLGDILVESGLLSEEDLSRALEVQKGSSKRLGEVLIDEKFISESDLVSALKKQLGIDFIDLTNAKIDSTLTSLIPKQIARQFRLIPVKIEGDKIYVAMQDPLNFRAIEAVKDLARKRVIPLFAYKDAIERALAVLYENQGAHAAIQEMRQEETLVTVEEKANEIDTSSAPTVKLVNSILERGVAEKASDVHIEPRENEIFVRLRVDGRLNEILRIPKGLQNAVISRLKVMASMNITERRIPQDGRATIVVDGKEVDMRINTLPTI